MSSDGESVNMANERRKILDGTYPSRIIEGRQRKHIEGTREFEQNREKMKRYGSNPSILTEDAQTIVDTHKGTGRIYFVRNSPDYPREDIDLGYIAGRTWSKPLGEYVDTSVVTISYSKTGAHVFPNDAERMK
ncbi:MAG: polymorphic toxin type 50 domain-containing protein [Oscillospiraceae bacterium]|nr:polymorphic toxin type 50 domain-containing protein [Oscillospiraceae bacterium]